MSQLRLILFIVFPILIFNITSLAQENSPINVPKVISGGVVNGKALSLIKPSYPLAAKAVRASGAVNVQVLIDENGNVVSASATSGHPLLRAAAVAAARGSKFSPTTLEGQPVKVTGVIVYNFVGLMNLTQIGFELATAEAAPNLDEKFPAGLINSSIRADWSEEKHLSQMLVDKQRWENSQKAVKVSPQIQSKTGGGAKREDGPATTGQRAVGGFTVGEIKLVEVKESHNKIIADLVNLLKTRLADDEIEKWSFALGLALGKINVNLGDDAKLRQSLIELKPIVATAPAKIKEDLVTELQTIADYGDKKSIKSADKTNIETFLNRMKD